MIKRIAVLLSIACLVACQPKKSNSSTETKGIKSFEWLIGTWEFKSPTVSIQETWAKTNDSIWQGSSFFIQELDTVNMESITIEAKTSGIFYIPIVINQNDGLPVYFKLKEQDDSSFTFENKGHDFPQLIKYRLVNADSLVAEISGQFDGDEKSEQIPMKRIQK